MGVKERYYGSKVSCPRTQVEPNPLDPESSALTIRPAPLPRLNYRR